MILWKVKPYSRRQLKIQDLQREEGSRECVWDISEQIQGTTRPKVVRDIILYVWVLHNMLTTHHGGANRAPTPANDAVTQQNEHAVYVPNENYRNPSREAKHQRELLKEYFSHVGALAWQEDRM